MNPSESFEKVIKAAKATGDYTPAWEKFANTEFFVPVLTQDSGNQTRDFHFAIHGSPQGEPSVLVSEDLEYLKASPIQKTIKIRGEKLISILNPQVSVLVALSDGAFGIPANLVAWLRASFQPAA
jgi:hypothetical protein